MNIRCWFGRHDWRQQWVHMHLFNICRRCKRLEWAGAMSGADEWPLTKQAIREELRAFRDGKSRRE